MSEHEIVGGDLVTDLSSFEYKHTVRLLVKGKLTGDDLPPSLKGLKLAWRCSAALLTQSVLVSAAHCFPRTMGYADPETGQLRRAQLSELNAEAFFKTDTRADLPSGTKSQKIIVHEGFSDDWTNQVDDVWNPEKAINDIAIVKLAENAPAEKQPAVLLGAKESPLSGNEAATLAGYGRDVTDEQISIPRLRSVTIPLRESLRNKSEWYVGTGDLVRGGKVDRPGGGCQGDSGGPVFVKRPGGVRLVGLIVRGPDEQNGGCQAAVTIATALPAYSNWINTQMSELSRP